MFFTSDLDEHLKQIKEIVEMKDRRIRYLSKENEQLRDEAYKDNELKEMKKDFDQMKNNLKRGFPISQRESELIDAWIKKHEEEAHGIKTDEQRLRAQGCSGGRYSYIFTPTGLGTSGVVRCSCGAEFEFQEIG